jgi:error-prone DNA polymerase
MVHADRLTAMTAYAELHCHSAYSFLDGASPPDEILAEAHRLGYPAIALTIAMASMAPLAFAPASLSASGITGASHTD